MATGGGFWVATGAQRAGRGEVGQIALGFGSAAGIHFVPNLVRRFRERFPDVIVYLKEMGTEAQVAALRSGELDVAIAYALPDEELQTRVLTTEGLVAVLPPHHPSARHELVAIEELTNDTLILTSHAVAAALREGVLSACASAGFQPKSIQEISTAQTAVGLAPGTWVCSA